MSVFRAGLFLIGSTLMGSGAQAALFCVDTSAELQQALTTAGSNAEADTIRIDSGHYEVSSGAVAFQYITTQNFSLTVTGGYLNCIVQSIEPNATVLSGSSARRVMQLLASEKSLGGITLSDLTLRNGMSSAGAGLNALTGAGFDGSINLNRVVVSDNVSSGSGAGVRIQTEGVVRILSSLFLNNRCGTTACAMDMTVDSANQSSTRLLIGGNTVVGHICDVGAPMTCDGGGARIDGTARAALYNNAFAFNEGDDLALAAATTALFNNNMVSLVGVPPLESSGNLALADPMFSNPFDDNYRLMFASPLRNAGTSSFTLGTLDLDGSPRVGDFVVDIGAFENHELLFADGFDFVQ